MENLIPTLNELGLDRNEAVAYISLLKHGSCRASEISVFTKTYRVKSYAILEKLKRYGLVTATLSSPTQYLANDPKESIDNLLRKKKQKLNDLEKNAHDLIKQLTNLGSNSVQKKLTSKFQVISGRSNIYEKISEIIQSSNTELILMASMAELVRKSFTTIPSVLSEAKDRGVEIKIVTEVDSQNRFEVQKSFDSSRIRLSKLPIHGRTLVGDQSMVMMSGTTDDDSKLDSTIDTTIYTDAPEIVANLRTFCVQMWNSGTKMKVKLIHK